jgi:phospho-N-acetylmuramoyl-pentapeptide-transferase
VWQEDYDWATLLAITCIGMVVAIIVIPTVIRVQRSASIGQNVYESGPAAHLVKQGTPTMGGLAFPLAAIAGAIYFYMTVGGGASHLLADLKYGILDGDFGFPIMIAGLVAIVAIVGFIDDFTSIKRRTAVGLRARSKLLLLILIAIIVARGFHEGHATDYLYTFSTGNAQWWFGRVIFLSDAWYYALAIAAFVGCANAVNLSDGVDGLAGSVALSPLLVLSFIDSWGMIGFAVAGALVVFLFFNRHPAKVFMGDTGSLTLGALLALLAIKEHLLLFLPLLGIVFVVETLSVIAQVISFKLTGKRIFKMSPLHHHFELSGWSERKITATFSATSVLASLAFCAIVYFTNLRILPH